jgi:hypothetical protein
MAGHGYAIVVEAGMRACRCGGFVGTRPWDSRKVTERPFVSPLVGGGHPIKRTRESPRSLWGHWGGEGTSYPPAPRECSQSAVSVSRLALLHSSPLLARCSVRRHRCPKGRPRRQRLRIVVGVRAGCSRGGGHRKEPRAYLQFGSLQTFASLNTTATLSLPHILFPARFGLFLKNLFLSSKYRSIAALHSSTD